VVRTAAGIAPISEGVITAVGWWDLLNRTIGYPIPTAGLEAQTKDYWRMTAPVETAMKALVQQNLVDRRGFPVHIPATQGRGPSKLLLVRMHTLLERAKDMLDGSGLVWTLTHTGDLDGHPEPLVFDAAPPTVHQAPLDYRGAVVGGDWELAAPGLTCAVIGGWGEGAARKFVVVSTSEDADMWAVEGFVDARDIQPAPGDTPPVTEADATAALLARGQEKLDEAASTVGMDLDVVDVPGFSYRAPYEVGDIVQVNLAPGWTVSDRVTSVTVTTAAEAGILFKPVVGGFDSSPDKQIAAAFRSMSARIRKSEVA
jgi:hypothetical protein